jgi:hypothetical protein
MAYNDGTDALAMLDNLLDVLGLESGNGNEPVAPSNSTKEDIRPKRFVLRESCAN